MNDSSSTGVMVVFSSPAPGVSEEAFNEWYDGTHAPEILKHVPGVLSVRRFRLAASQMRPSEAQPFLAIYEIDRPAEEVLKSLSAASPSLTFSDVLDRETNIPALHVYDSLAERDRA